LVLMIYNLNDKQCYNFYKHVLIEECDEEWIGSM